MEGKYIVRGTGKENKEKEHFLKKSKIVGGERNFPSLRTERHRNKEKTMHRLIKWQVEGKLGGERSRARE